jgi:hypothetical protein
MSVVSTVIEECRTLIHYPKHVGVNLIKLFWTYFTHTFVS